MHDIKSKHKCETDDGDGQQDDQGGEATRDIALSGDQKANRRVSRRDTETKESPKRSSLFELADFYGQLIELIEDGEQSYEDTLKLFETFELAKDATREKVDACIQRLKFVQERSDAIAAEYEYWKLERERANKALDRFKNYLLSCAQKADAPLNGTLQKLVAQKNSQPRLDYKDDMPSKSFQHVVADDDITFGRVPPEYVREIKLRVVNTERVKLALQKGVDLPFVSLTQGFHIRVKT